MQRRDAAFLFFITFVALLARSIPPAVLSEFPIKLDMHQYDSIARSLAEGRGYRWFPPSDAQRFAEEAQLRDPEVTVIGDPRGIRTSFRPPLYPLFLSLIYRQVDAAQSTIAVRYVQAMLGALSVVLTYFLAKAVGCGRSGSRFAATIVAVYPMLVLYPIALLTENLYIPLVIGTILAIAIAAKNDGPAWAGLAGVLAGLTALTRSLFVAIWPILIYWLWQEKLDHRTRLIACGMAITGMLAATVPWAVRNSLLHGKPMWLDSSLGYVLYVSYHPTSTGTVRPETTLDLLRIHDDADRNSAGIEASVSFIRSNPGRALSQVAARIFSLWGLEWREFFYVYSNNLVGVWAPWRIAGILGGLGLALPIVILLAVRGLLSSANQREARLLLASVVVFAAVHALTISEPRYHLPMVPILAVGAGMVMRSSPQRSLVRKSLLAMLPLLAYWALEIYDSFRRIELLMAFGGNKLYWGY